jgi:hypothetical protein
MEREVFVYHGRGAEDPKRLAAAMATKLSKELYAAGGRLYLLSDKKLIVVSRAMLKDLIDRHYCTVRLRPANGPDEWEPEFGNLDLSSQDLVDVHSSLLLLAAAAPVPRPQLSEQHKSEIRMRRKNGRACPQPLRRIQCRRGNRSAAGDGAMKFGWLTPRTHWRHPLWHWLVAA